MADARVHEDLPPGTSSVVFDAMQFDLVAAIAHIENLYTNKEVKFHQILQSVCRDLQNYDYGKYEVDGQVPLSVLHVKAAVHAWQPVFGFNGPRSPWKLIWDELSEDKLFGKDSDFAEFKSLLQDALEAGNSDKLVRILAKGHRDSNNYLVYLYIPRSSRYSGTSASRRELATQLSEETASNTSLLIELALLNEELVSKQEDLASLQEKFFSKSVELNVLKRSLASSKAAAPETDQATKKRKLAEMSSNES